MSDVETRGMQEKVKIYGTDGGNRIEDQIIQNQQLRQQLPQQLQQNFPQ